jgi:uncharacterized iron-regulated membrane protein
VLRFLILQIACIWSCVASSSGPICWPRVLACSVILILCITGTLLAYEKQLLAWADRAVNTVPGPPGATRLPIDDLLAAFPGTVALSLSRDPAAAVQLTLPGNWLSTSILNTCSSARRTVGLRPGLLPAAPAVAPLAGREYPYQQGHYLAPANLAFLFLLLTGVPMWLQRPIGWFRRGLSPKARDYNWHHVLGIWCAVPLLLIAGTAVFFFLCVGHAAAVPAHREAAPVESSLRHPAPVLTSRSSTASKPRTGRSSPSAPAPGPSPWKRVPGAASIARVPGRCRIRRWSDRRGLKRCRWPWAAPSPGPHGAHRGGSGSRGQAIAGLASAAGAVLVYTGLALSWRPIAGGEDGRPCPSAQARRSLSAPASRRNADRQMLP